MSDRERHVSFLYAKVSAEDQTGEYKRHTFPFLFRDGSVHWLLFSL